MKVLATEDVKVAVEEKGEGPPRSTLSYEYEPKPEPRNYVNFSKLVLLALTIIASFLLCLIFARDLWGQKAEKPEIAHPQRQAQRASDGSPRFPFADSLFESLRDLPFEKEFRGKSAEDDPKVVSKTTKITFRILPSDGSESSQNLFDRDGPISGSPIDGMMKAVMEMLGEMPDHPSPMVEKPSLLSDLQPVFHHHDRVHPKLIVVRKMNPSSSPNHDDFFKNILDEVFNSPKISKQDQEEPFPFFFPVQPVHHNTEALDTGLDRVFPFLKHIVVKAKPIAPSHPKLIPQKAEENPESWNQYKYLVSELAGSVDTLLDDTSSLKELVINTTAKFESSAAPAETTEAPQTSEGDVGSKEQSSATPQPQVPSNVQQFLKDAEDLLNKIGIALTETSVLIKTEDAALDVMKRADRDGLITAIDSFIKSVHPTLDEVFEASTKLTKTNGSEKEIPEDIYTGIVKLGKELIHFGKLVYEKMTNLRKTLDSHKSQETITNGVEAKTALDVPSLIPPVAQRRIVIFNSNPNSFLPFKPEELNNGRMLTL